VSFKMECCEALRLKWDGKFVIGPSSSVGKDNKLCMSDDVGGVVMSVRRKKDNHL